MARIAQSSRQRQRPQPVAGHPPGPGSDGGGALHGCLQHPPARQVHNARAKPTPARCCQRTPTPARRAVWKYVLRSRASWAHRRLHQRPRSMSVMAILRQLFRGRISGRRPEEAMNAVCVVEVAYDFAAVIDAGSKSEVRPRKLQGLQCVVLV